MTRLIAIDPGNTESAFVMLEDYKPYKFGKITNDQLVHTLKDDWIRGEPVVIERIASYGMAVGRDVFETCEWIGRFTQVSNDLECPVSYVYRADEKKNICKNPTASDANIRRALIDRFAQHDLKNGKGTKKNPDWFYGFAADVWAAYAVGITWMDMQKEKST